MSNPLTEKTQIAVRAAAVPVVICALVVAGWTVRGFIESFRHETNERIALVASKQAKELEIVMTAVRVNQEFLKTAQINIEANRSTIAEGNVDRLHGKEFDYWVQLAETMNEGKNIIWPKRPR